MADKRIIISNPILQSGEYFSVRYREVGSPTWINYGNADNTPFILSLSYGEYELEVFHMRSASPAIMCGYNRATFSIIDTSCDCFDDLEIVKVADNGAFYTVTFNVTAPSNATNFRYEAYDSTGTQVAIINTRRGVGSFNLSKSAGAEFEIVGFLSCDDGNTWQECQTITFEPEPAECVPMSGLSARYVPVWASNRFYIEIAYTQSIPATINASVNYVQTNPVMNGAADSGNLVINNITSPIMIPVNPNWSGGDLLDYDVTIVDECGKLHTLSTSS